MILNVDLSIIPCKKNNDQSFAFQILQEYYVSNYFSMFHKQSLQRQQYNLAKINLYADSRILKF